GEGRFDEALAAWEAEERDARATGAWFLGLDRSVWVETKLDAAVGLLRRGCCDRRQRARVERAARWLVARGVFNSGCLGHRPLAAALPQRPDAHGLPVAAGRRTRGRRLAHRRAKRTAVRERGHLRPADRRSERES